MAATLRPGRLWSRIAVGADPTAQYGAGVPTEPPDDPARLAWEVAALVAGHPAVSALHPGPFGTVATHLPGRERLAGVRFTGGATGAGDPPTGVELAVVARLGPRLPDLADQLAALVRDRLGPVPVDVTICDLVEPGDGDAPGRVPPGRLA